MDDILAGFRIGGAILWAWMLWRVLFESADIHSAPDLVRRAGWVHFRRFIVIMGSSIVFFTAPENILRASDRISFEVSLFMNSCAAFLVMVAAILVHHGLDIATERKPYAITVSFRVYILIAIISVIYSLGAAII